MSAGLALVLALELTAAPAPVPCDTTRIELLPAGEAVDAMDAFLRNMGHLVAHRLVGVAEERAAALLRLDAVSLRDANGEVPGRVRLSKHLGSRLEMSYVAAIGHAADQRLRLDVRITDSVVLESASDQQGRAASDIVWRWRFP